MLKKLLAFFLVVAGVFTLSACNLVEEGLNDLDKIDEAMAELDVEPEVTDDITLPTVGLHEVEITWESSNPDIIAPDGTVNRPLYSEGDQTVTLTANLTIGENTLVKEFDVTVKAAETETDAEKVEAAKTVLLLSASGLVVSNIDLPETALESTVTWESSNPELISADGTVTRPAAGEGNQTVVLTATLTVGDATTTKEFELTVKEEDPSNVDLSNINNRLALFKNET
ncbi:MAG: hypothetical protein K9L74_05825 [Candidatus Izimaplasma sp.]|nr:hypothetical protein [Candidatus Izimaplasma bacterium]